MLGRFAGALECQLLHFSISHFDHAPELKRSTAWPSTISLPLAPPRTSSRAPPRSGFWPTLLSSALLQPSV